MYGRLLYKQILQTNYKNKIKKKKKNTKSTKLKN